MIGDLAYGGPMGLASSVADYGFQQLTGKDFGDTVYDFVFGEDGKPAVPGAKPATALASKDPTPLMKDAPVPKPSDAPPAKAADAKPAAIVSVTPPAAAPAASAAPKPN